ncbi:glycosyl hydrolase family 18 protein [Paenibacillus sp. LHD-117]|uniref:glycosyl hydrolase family 18 protein n=1 Tax=Paenibacillus sp. LHD-117 TaxID=3071412 RepID=UPI0027DF05ED|nr:glycosyl hydrolase family 18 protein [Paenibacillus sp. LHD-117]MDQ6418536.1 glycosyl hydrolase family 18 protein [Paenibacillus sp. LHD-117]
MMARRSGGKKWSVRFMLMAMLVSLASAYVPVAYGAAGTAATTAAGEDYKIVGYFPAWGAYGRAFNVTDIDASKLTHINYAFADICWNGIHGNPDPESPNPQTWSCQNEAGQAISVPNGTVVLGDPWIDTGKAFPGDTWDQPIKGNLNQLIKLKQANPHLKTIISVGGWSWSNRFSDVAATQATRETFAKSAVDFIRKYQMDGVDLDWEYPVGGGLAGNSYRPADKQNHVLLLQEVRKQLDAAETADGKSYSLTIASGASPSYASNNELGQIGAVVDWINIMTYDFNGGWSTLSAHNAPLYADAAAVQAGVPEAAEFNTDRGVQRHLDAGVPANKIVLGLPFYGRGWAGCAPGASGDGQYQACTGSSAGTWEKGVLDYGDILTNYVNKNGFVRYWNDVAKVPYLYNASTKVFISYDDEQSFGVKIDYIKSKGLAGGMFWELSSDCRVSSKYSCSGTKLLNVLHEKLLNGETPGGGNEPDVTAPNAPTGLAVTGKTGTSVSLSWNAATDDRQVTGYQVFVDGTLKTSVAGTSATVTGLSGGTAYSFAVKARDAAGNVSAASASISATTDVVTVPPCSVSDWQPTAVYTGGNQAVYNGIIYEAKWWTQGDRPDLSGPWGVWKVIGTCGSGGGTGGDPGDGGTGGDPGDGGTGGDPGDGGTGGDPGDGGTGGDPGDGGAGAVAWTPGTAYTTGSEVTYGGKTYVCLQSHTALTGWEPATTLALWKLKV